MTGPARPDDVAPLPPGDDAYGRVARLRLAASRSAERYQRLAQQHPLLGLPLVFAARHTERQGVVLASALAFRLFIWFVPLSLLLAGILAGYSSEHSADIRSAAKAAGITGAASNEVVTALQAGRRSWWLAVLIGAAIFVWATRTLVIMLTAVHAHLWQATPVRRAYRTVVANVLLLDGVWLVLLALALAMRRLDHLLPGGLVMSAIVQSLLTAGAWLLVSLRLPDKRERWTDLVPGALVVGFGLAVLHAVSRVYIPQRLARSSQLYGSLGIAIVILFWLLVIAELIVGAALLNVVLVDYRRSQDDDGRAASASS